MDRRPRRHPVIVRLARGAELALLGLMGFLVVVDIGLATNRGGLSWLAPLTGAVTTVAVALRRQWLERGTAVAVACSLAVSLLAVDHTVNPSAATVMGLLALTVLVTRVIARPELALYLFGLGLAIVAEGLRGETQGPSVAFLLTWPFAGAVAFGGYLRWLDIDPDALPPAVAAAVHRIVLESLTNVRRHAVDVTRVDVTVARRGTTVEVVVRDDGREAHLRSLRAPGYGLVGMTERAAALGGTLTAGPVPDGKGHGWQVAASLPLDPQDRTR